MIKHVTIIGCGAIGQLWAHHLTQAGCSITLVGRRERSNASFVLHTLDGNVVTHRFNYLNQQVPVKSDLVIVTTKAYQVASALSPYLAALGDCPIVLMHNGLGSVEQLPDSTSHQLFLATTSQAALLTHAELRHTGPGPTMIGSYDTARYDKAKQIANLLDSALAPVTAIEDIQSALWNKLAINCVINPLTALHNCCNGDIAKPQYAISRQQVIAEVIRVAQVKGLALTTESVTTTVDLVIKNTAKNFSSMHQDLLHQRKTEIDYINGYVASQGQLLNVDTPENMRLWQAIQQRSN